ncbi:MAG: LacI family DNA-binding transcriptional regulator [Pauljensenia sp.]
MPEPDDSVAVHRPHIRDVARLAGVSVATVSRVLNGSAGVTEATRARVTAAIKETSYVPLSAARNLSLGSSGDLSVISPDPADFGYAQEIIGASQICHDRGVGINVRLVVDSVADAAGQRAFVQGLLALGTGPMIIIDTLPSAHEMLLTLAPHLQFVPLVRSAHQAQELVGLGSAREALWIDEREGLALATRYLMDRGHRRIVHVAVPQWRAGERDAGYRETMEQAGLPGEVITAEWDAASGYRAAEQLLGRRDVTAVVCGSDALALGVIRRLHEVGLRVPEDISVMGFDDRPDASLYVPALTTVHADFLGLGRAAARLAFDSDLRAGDAFSSEVTPMEVIVRESVTEPRRS